MANKIALLGLEFHGYHGVHPEEGKLGARFVVDVEFGLDLDGGGDDLAGTVDYSAVYRLVREEVEGPRCHLIEALANRVADRLHAGFPRMRRLLVRVHKPHAPLGGVFRDLYAEVARER